MVMYRKGREFGTPEVAFVEVKFEPVETKGCDTRWATRNIIKVRVSQRIPRGYDLIFLVQLSFVRRVLTGKGTASVSRSRSGMDNDKFHLKISFLKAGCRGHVIQERLRQSLSPTVLQHK